MPLDVTLGYVLDGDGGFAELGGHEEARRHLPTSAWRDEHAFADLSSIEETRYDVRATLRTDVEAAEAVVEFLAARLAGIGLEPVRIASLGDGRIEAKLRAVASSGLVADALRPRGRLEFRLMPDPRDVRDARWNVLDALDEEDRVLFRDWPYGSVESVVFSMVHQRDTARVGEILLRPEIADLVPSGMRLMWYARAVSVESDEPATYQLAVRSGAPAMTHEVIIESRVERDAFTQLPMVSLTMSDEGAATWADLTERNVGRQVAMIVDDIVYSFPRIIDRITGGRTQITGLSPEEAERLAVLLTPGELPAPVEIVEIQTSKSQAGLEVIQPGFESYGIPVGWQLSRSRWRVPVANADKPVADGPVLVLLYEGEIPTTFIVTELSGDEMILHGAGSNMEQTTLILRRGPAGQQAP